MKELNETDVLMLRKLDEVRQHFQEFDHDFRILEACFVGSCSYDGETIKDRNEFDHLIKGDLVEYRKPIEFATEYDGQKVYGMDDWNGDFSEQFSPGMFFNVEIAEWFLDCVPPESHSLTYIQCGEPYSHIDGKATYTTFECVKGDINKTDSVWRYCGHCFSKERVEYKGE
ncbi:MAG: hypothetical protein J6S67_05030 [Methanobrevibacter sp.]|nr:hypothetical protein [Methanobrevibacter sp.]